MQNDNLNSNFEEIIKISNENFIKNDLIPFLRIPSNSLNKAGIIEAKKYLINYISEICQDFIEIEGEFNPLFLYRVLGNNESKDTLLIYMMYDTQPINREEDWISPPFGAEIRKLPPPLDDIGDCIIARGAYNSKTPLLCFLNIINILKQKNKLPLSLLLLFDGEEEIGSPTLINLLNKKDNRTIFNNCIDVYYPSAKQDLNGKSVIKLGYKGILSLTIKISTENKEPHSAFSAMIPSPASDLISLINLFYSEGKFQINCLKSKYQMSQEEESLINDLIKTIDFKKMKNKTGITQTLKDNVKDAIIDYLFKPTFNISTLKSGFMEKGIKNYVPNEAVCNIDIRFAHNISSDKIFEEIERMVINFSKNKASRIDLVKNIGYERSRVKKNSILVESLIKSSQKLGFSTEIWPLSAAAAPLSRIQKKLKLNFIGGGLGLGGYAHSPNEFFQIDSIIKNRLSNYYFLENYSRLLFGSKLV